MSTNKHEWGGAFRHRGRIELEDLEDFDRLAKTSMDSGELDGLDGLNKLRGFEDLDILTILDILKILDNLTDPTNSTVLQVLDGIKRPRRTRESSKSLKSSVLRSRGYIFTRGSPAQSPTPNNRPTQSATVLRDIFFPRRRVISVYGALCLCHQEQTADLATWKRGGCGGQSWTRERVGHPKRSVVQGAAFRGGGRKLYTLGMEEERRLCIGRA